MCLTKVLLCFLFIYSCNALKSCSSCKIFRLCPEAVKYSESNADSIEKLKSALCGIESTDNQMLPKICCSDFATTENRFREDDPETLSLQSHPNYELLSKKCGDINGDRIIGGNIAKLYEFPWMTLLSYRSRVATGKNHYQFKCGGTIINSRYILTAAHCINQNLIGVRIGEFNINTKEDCQGEYPEIICENNVQDIFIEENIPHEDYQRSPVKNDIALVRLKRPIDLTQKNTKPICLPIHETSSKDVQKSGTVAGWGITEFDRTSPLLLKVEVPILTNEACSNLYNRNSNNTEFTEKKFCAGEIGKDSCNGDSGGPLMVEKRIDGKARIIQYGIVSFGPKQCGSQLPGVYTDINYYKKWILDNIKP